MSYLKNKRGCFLRAYKSGEKASDNSPPTAPKPTRSKIYQDGFMTGESYMDGGDTVNKSYSTPFQLEQQKLQQQYLPDYTQRILNPSVDVQSSWNAIANANKAEQMKNFNESFGKTRDNLIQNISSRGLMRSSAVPYMTNELAKTSANTLNSIENQYIADQQNARDREYNYNQAIYNMLQGGLGQQLALQQQNLSNANTGFQLGNNFNQTNYQNQMNGWQMQQYLKAQQAARPSMMGQLLGLAGTLGGAALGNPAIGGLIGGAAGKAVS
jgi:hypothetical protein